MHWVRRLCLVKRVRQKKKNTILCLCHYVKVIEFVMEGACSAEHEVNKQMRNLKAKAIIST